MPLLKLCHNALTALLAAGILLFSCHRKPTEQAPTAPEPGRWRAEIRNAGGLLPFGLQISRSTDTSFAVLALNADEKLPMDTAFFRNDSLVIPMQLFEAELVGRLSPDGKTLTGFYQRPTRTGISKLPFSARQGPVFRFQEKPDPQAHNIAGKYATVFQNKEGKQTQAVGVFEQNGSRVKGTFLTTTGDYRYLDGDVVGDSLFLSAYDGSHLLLFKARAEGATLRGELFSGLAGHSTFTATKDPTAALPDERTLTLMKPGSGRFTFTFPDAATGKPVSLADERFKNKVVVVQLLGSWCPNCMDESNFLAPWYEKNKDRGVEIVGLAFERSPDVAVASQKVLAMKQRLHMGYPVLVAGQPDENAGKSLPQLNRIMGYPTTIFIDRKGNVREIHTGFSGPGTGAYYEAFVDNFTRLTDKLLAER